RRAQVADENVFRSDAHGNKLRAIRLSQIEVNAFGWRLVARRSHVEPLQWIRFFPGARFIEVVNCVRELGSEFSYELSGNFIAAGPSGRNNRSKNVTRSAAVFVPHATDSFFRDAREGSLPTGVDRGDSTFFRVDQKKRHAVGSLDGEKQARRVR